MLSAVRIVRSRAGLHDRARSIRSRSATPSPPRAAPPPPRRIPSPRTPSPASTSPTACSRSPCSPAGHDARLLGRSHAASRAGRGARNRWTRSHGSSSRPALVPTDGIVKETATKIVGSSRARHRQGARDLRLGRRDHVPRSEGARLRYRRRPRDARIEELRRQVRRPECALRRSGARGRPPGAPCVWPARCAIRSRLQEPRPGHGELPRRASIAARKCI